MKKLSIFAFTLFLLISCGHQEDISEERVKLLIEADKKTDLYFPEDYQYTVIPEKEKIGGTVASNNFPYEKHDKTDGSNYSLLETLTAKEVEFLNCYRQCRRSNKKNKAPSKMVIDASDLKLLKLPKIEFNKDSFTDSDNLYNAYMTVVQAYCVEGCQSSGKIGIAGKITEQFNEYSLALEKLKVAQALIEKAKSKRIMKEPEAKIKKDSIKAKKKSI